MGKELKGKDDVPMIRDFGKADRTLQYLAVISVSMGTLCAGCSIAWSSPAISQLLPPENPNSTQIKPPFTITAQEAAYIGSILNIGGLLVAIPIGTIADKYGRKMAIYLAGLAFLLSWVFIVLATSPMILIIGRFFAGMGLGAICVSASIYLGEIAEPKILGLIMSIPQIFIAGGILIVYAINPLTDYLTLSMILSVFPIIHLVTFVFLPESFVYYLKCGRVKDAEKSMIKFRGHSYNVQGEMKILKEEIESTKNVSSGSFKDLFNTKLARKTMIIGVGVMAYQQLVGVNALSFYIEQIFKATDTIDPSKAALIIAVLQLAASYFALNIVERIGRKTLLMFASAGIFIALSGLGIFFQFKALNIKTFAGFNYLPLICIILYCICFSAGFGAVPFILVQEIFIPEIRGKAFGIVIVVNWCCSFLVTYFFPLMILKYGSFVTFYTLAGFTATALVFSIFVVPETKGKSLRGDQNFRRIFRLD